MWAPKANIPALSLLLPLPLHRFLVCTMKTSLDALNITPNACNSLDSLHIKDLQINLYP